MTTLAHASGDLAGSRRCSDPDARLDVSAVQRPSDSMLAVARFWRESTVNGALYSFRDLSITALDSLESSSYTQIAK